MLRLPRGSSALAPLASRATPASETGKILHADVTLHGRELFVGRRRSSCLNPRQGRGDLRHPWKRHVCFVTSSGEERESSEAPSQYRRLGRTGRFDACFAADKSLLDHTFAASAEHTWLYIGRPNAATSDSRDRAGSGGPFSEASSRCREYGTRASSLRCRARPSPSAAARKKDKIKRPPSLIC